MKNQITITIIIILGITFNLSAQKYTAKDNKTNTYRIAKVKSEKPNDVKEIKGLSNEKSIKPEIQKLNPANTNEAKPINKNKFFKYYIRLAKGDGNFA